MDIITCVRLFHHGNEGDVWEWRTKTICHTDGDRRVFAKYRRRAANCRRPPSECCCLSSVLKPSCFQLMILLAARFVVIAYYAVE